MATQNFRTLTICNELSCLQSSTFWASGIFLACTCVQNRRWPHSHSSAVWETCRRLQISRPS